MERLSAKNAQPQMILIFTPLTERTNNLRRFKESKRKPSHEWSYLLSQFFPPTLLLLWIDIAKVHQYPSPSTSSRSTGGSDFPTCFSLTDMWPLLAYEIWEKLTGAKSKQMHVGAGRWWAMLPSYTVVVRVGLYWDGTASLRLDHSMTTMNRAPQTTHVWT